MSSSRDDDPPTGDSRIRTGRLLNQVSTQAKQRGADLARTVASNDLAKGLGNIDLTPGRFKRRYQETGVVGLITQFPIAVLAVFLVGTLFFVYHSGALDDTGLHAPEEPSLNVNGDLEAYLPSGSEVSEELAKVEEDWSTNVMIIYVESPNQNITTRTILLQMDEVERALNPVLSDGGEEDGIIYALSISTGRSSTSLNQPDSSDGRRIGFVCMWWVHGGLPLGGPRKRHERSGAGFRGSHRSLQHPEPADRRPLRP